MTVLAALLAGCVGESSDSASDGTARTGTGGSMARFSIVGDRLYALTDRDLQLFDITDPSDPHPTSRVAMNFFVETLFAYQDYLFIGGPTGMYIYDNTDPAAPKYLSEFTHARACDPVVVQDNYAYITLHSGGTCWGNQNVLEVVDLTDITKPTLVKSIAMQSPLGLAVDGDKLFVCDGIAGLKTFSVSDPTLITQLDVARDIDCYDVIAQSGQLLATAKTGLMLYSYDMLPPTLVSNVPTTTAAQPAIR